MQKTSKNYKKGKLIVITDEGSFWSAIKFNFENQAKDENFGWYMDT